MSAVPGPVTPSSPSSPDVDADGLGELALRAFVYGFPLVFDLDQVARYVTTGVGANPAAAFNSFSHARTLSGPEDKFVTINNDTVYSMSQLDLSNGPLVLEVPDTDGRYYVLQFVSAWTDNFAYVGQRATGTGPGRFLITPPGWTGEVPSDCTAIESPTAICSIVGRWAVDADGDLAAVHALQDATTLTPLQPSDASLAGLPSTDGLDGLSPALQFWEKYRRASRAFPPAARDKDLQASFARLWLTGEAPLDTAPVEVRAALEQGHSAGIQHLQQSLRGGQVAEVAGWLITLHVFDYNLDHFGVGTIDDARWRIEDSDRRLLIRAGAALGGLWGNHAYEAAYLGTYVDDHGQQLTGAHDYTLTLAPTPPNEGFWSLTMYDVPDYYLVDNPIQRYSIGDRTPGLVFDADGGLTIRISATEPKDAAARANWLPAPPGPFRPMLRVYVPGSDVLDGRWTPAPITRV